MDLRGTVFEKSTSLVTGSIAKSATKVASLSELSPLFAGSAFSGVQVRGVLRSSALVKAVIIAKEAQYFTDNQEIKKFINKWNYWIIC